MKILVADDDQDIREAVAACLQREGLQVCFAADGEEAIRCLTQDNVDLALLDVMMPKCDGYEVVRRIRGQGIDKPVIFLSARGEEVSQVLGLELGADDYVVKPFSGASLVARVRAHLRRYGESRGVSGRAHIIRYGDLSINSSSCEVVISGRLISLTAKEYELLLFMASHHSQVFTREQLFRQVWGEDYYGDDNTVTVHISRLREKLEEHQAKPRWIVTVRGLGYKFVGDMGSGS